MKRTKIRLDVEEAMRQTNFGTPERTAAISRLMSKWHITSERLRVICLAGGGRSNYWVH